MLDYIKNLFFGIYTSVLNMELLHIIFGMFVVVGCIFIIRRMMRYV